MSTFYIQGHQDVYASFIDSDWDDWIASQRNVGKYAGHVEMHALAEIYGISVTVYRYSLNGDTNQRISTCVIPGAARKGDPLLMMSVARQRKHFTLLERMVSLSGTKRNRMTTTGLIDQFNGVKRVRVCGEVNVPKSSIMCIVTAWWQYHYGDNTLRLPRNTDLDSLIHNVNDTLLGLFPLSWKPGFDPNTLSVGLQSLCADCDGDGFTMDNVLNFLQQRLIEVASTSGGC